tara:strand:- start:953 stop:1186 length:234 start_codon:yes stop_codon:yes gene_type:complete
MPAKRKPPPQWWLLGYMAQYQPSYLIDKLQEIGLDAQALYEAAGAAAVDLPNENYRRLSKSWAVRQHRVRTKTSQKN